jgi:small conductance mechanosensitive channel
MLDRAGEWFTTAEWWGVVVRIVIFYALAFVVHRRAGRVARRVVRLSRFSPSTRQPRAERRATLRGLIAGAISFIAFAAATLASLGQFVPVDTLVWMVGLFSAAFGLGARPLISDVLTGVGLIFEDTFAVGEKIEVLQVAGVVEAVHLRTTRIRAPTGELYVVPNGEVRVVRNFSRGSFSTAKVTLRIPATDLGRALSLLEELGTEAVILLPNLLEPWQVLSESGEMGQQTELTLLARARFGRAAEMRPRLLALVQGRLAEAGIILGD